MSESENPESFEPELRLIVLDKPLWYDGLAEPSWALPQKTPPSLNLGLMSWTQVRTSDSDEITQRREDALGRLTRSIPLYLAEAFLFETEAFPQIFLPIAEGLGLVLLGEPWIPTREQLPPHEPLISSMITGTLRGTLAELKLQANVSDPESGKELQTFEAVTTIERAGEAVMEIKKKLFAYYKKTAKLKERKAPSFYHGLTPPFLGSYLLILGQILALHQTKCRRFSKEGLWGVRNILDNTLNFALLMPGKPFPFLLFFAGISYLYSLEIEAYHEYRRAAFQVLLDEEKAGSLIRQFAPVIYRIYDQHDELLLAEKKAGAQDSAYSEWVKTLRQYPFRP